MRNEEGFSMYDLRFTKILGGEAFVFHPYLNLANLNSSLGLQSEDEDEDFKDLQNIPRQGLQPLPLLNRR
jgi:hypothetical protein